MPAPEGTLRLLKGGQPTSGAPGRRRTTRRTVTRRPPPEADPVTEALRTLDTEPELVTEPEPDVEAATERPARRSTAERARRRAAPRATVTRPPAGRRSRWSLPTSRPAVLAMILCAVLAAAGFFGYRWYGDRQLDTAHQRALAAAKQTTVNFVSVSASSVDRDLQRIVAGSTGDFREEFTRGQAQVRAAIMANNVESRGTVLRAALLSGTRTSAVVLIAMDATVRNTNAPNGRVSHYRIQATVTRDAKSGRWLVSQLQFVG